MNYKLESPHQKGRHKKYAPLEGRQEADVAVVGGGIAGTAIAHETAKRGYKVVLVEKGAIGSMASSAAVGMTIGETFELGELSTIIGYDAAMEDYRRNFDTQSRLSEFARSIGVNSYTPSGAVAVILDNYERSKMIKDAKDDVEFREKHGLPVMKFLSPEEVRHYANMPNAVAGLYYSGDEVGKIDPAELLQKLAESAVRNGASIYERTAATGMTRNGDRVTITTDSGEIDSRYAIIATNGITFDGTFSRYIEPCYTHVTVTEPLGDRIKSAGFPNGENVWTFTDNPAYLYLTTTDDGRLICGGEDVEARGRRPHPERTSPIRYERIHRRMTELMPSMEGIEMAGKYNGYFTNSPDYVPIIEFDGNVYTIHSLTDSGIVKGLTIASLMPEELDGKRPEYFRICDARRFTK